VNGTLPQQILRATVEDRDPNKAIDALTVEADKAVAESLLEETG
jgi:hypothetical protein